MRALQLPRTLALTFVIVPAIMALQPTHLEAEQAQTGKYVYVMTNKTPHNSVIQYLRAGDGQLAFVREVPTGGSGTGPNGADPLGSQDSLVLSGNGQFLLAANAGSN